MVSGSRRVGRLKARNKIQSEARAAVALKAIGYLRVSTEEQAQSGFGLDAQEDAVRKYADAVGLELVEVIADPGVSGTTRPAERPGFARVLELAGERCFSVLLVKRFDRLARNIALAVTTSADLDAAHGVTIRSVTEAIDTGSPSGKLIFSVFSAMAENERDAIVDRTAGGRMQKASKGGFAGGRVPYGYTRDANGSLQVVPAQARIVRRIYEERRRKRTLRAIADGLNRDGIPSPGGAAWHPYRVGYVVDNPKYRGAIEYLFRWNGVETHVLQPDAHAAIIG